MCIATILQWASVSLIRYLLTAHPYPLSTHPVSPPVMTLKSERALPRIGELRGETLQRPEQLLDKKRTFGFVSKGRVNKVKEPVFDHDEVA